MPLSVLASRRRRENDWTGAHRYHPKKVVVGDPEVVQQRLADGDKFVILACDGIWDVMTNDKAVSIVARALRDGRLMSIGGGTDEIMLGIICKLEGTLPGSR